MTDEFDQTRSYSYRNGEEPLAVFALPSPTEHGDTFVSIAKSGRTCTHFVDGRVWRGQDCTLDLVNIPEEVTVEMWAIVNKINGHPVSWARDVEPMEQLRCKNEVVVRMTGTYTR